ncbi:MAG: DUF2892 domain-containing protein [Candidatus Kapabacteria bacterium]|nr:DUF2892 domain-containing protein [Candidatus Kapabacteria bacterium]
MIKNMGSIDRLIRIAIAITVFALIASEQISGTAAWVLGIVAIIMAATSAMGSCPLYLPLGLSTKPKK